MNRFPLNITRTSNLFIATVCLLAVASFSSCTVTDLPEPQDDEVTFQVELVKMTALEIKSEEGEHLEIYGSVMAELIRDNLTETNTLWKLDAPSYLDVGLNDILVNERTSFTLLKSNLEASAIDVTASLSDYDSATNPAEFLGSETITLPLSVVTTSIELQMVLRESGGQVLQVTYVITRL